MRNKKIIITEEQLKSLVSYIKEADEEVEDDSTVEPEGEDKTRQILEEIQGEFIRNLSDAQIFDDIAFAFGDVDEEGVIIKDSLKTVVLRVLSKGSLGVRAKLMNSSGIHFPKPTAGGEEEGAATVDDNVIILVDKNSFRIVKEKDDYVGQIGLKMVTGNKENGDEIYGSPHVFNDFLYTEKIPNGGDENSPIQNEEELKANVETKIPSFDKIDKTLTNTEFSPALFGMDNIFFYPKGFAAMDNILSKYGTSVNRGEKAKYISFSIITGLKDTSLKTGIDVKKAEIETLGGTTKFRIKDNVLELPEDAELKDGEKIDVKVYGTDRKGKTSLFKGNATIKITEV